MIYVCDRLENAVVLTQPQRLEEIVVGATK